MKSFHAILGVMLLGSSTALAQNICATQFGSCAMAVASVAGNPCYCVTPNGPVQGFTQAPPAVLPMPGPASAPMAPMGGDPFPHFCCTPAGRLGPFQNTSIAPGQVCSAPTPAGLAMGQACF
jgi:hypothetical protein